MRQAILCFLFAFGGYSSSDEPPGLVWLGHQKGPICGGILIEPDIVVTAKTCLESYVEVIWPFKSKSDHIRRHTKADLAILILENSYPNTVQRIHISELGNLKRMLPIYFTDKRHQVKTWIHAMDEDSAEFTPYLSQESLLKGSPVWTDLESGGPRVIGMMIEERKALRLDPYFNYMTTEIDLGREKRRLAPSNSTEDPLPPVQKPAIKIPAQVLAEPSKPESTPEPQVEPRVEPSAGPAPILTPASVPTRPPESLGCSCSQVRR